MNTNQVFNSNQSEFEFGLIQIGVWFESTRTSIDLDSLGLNRIDFQPIRIKRDSTNFQD